MAVVTHLYETYEDAQRAHEQLRAAGVPDADISIVANNADNRYRTGSDGSVDRDRDGTDDRVEAAATGGSIGATVGGAAGLLAGLGILAIPGIGPVVAAGWLASMALGAVVGGGTGGLIGALTQSGMPEEEAHVYAEGVRRGGTLLTARVPDSDQLRVETLLGSSAVDVKTRADAYRASGWNRFDHQSAGMTADEIRRERERQQGVQGGASGMGSEESNLVSSQEVDGTEIYDQQGKHIGEVDHLMIDKKSGQVAYVVARFGGFLGMGEGYHPVPWAALKYDTPLGGYRTSVTEQQLRDAPEFTDRSWEDRDWETRTHRHYSAREYWGRL